MHDREPQNGGESKRGEDRPRDRPREVELARHVEPIARARGCSGCVTTTLELHPGTNIRELVDAVPIARDVLEGFGLHCSGCGVNKYETLAQGTAAHGLRIEAVIAALEQARRTGRMPAISEADRTPARRAPGSFSRRASFGAVVPVMSGKGGVGKSLTTALLAIGLRRAGKRVGILDADITGPSIPRLFGLRGPMRMEADPDSPPGQQPRPLFMPLRSRSAIEVISSNLLTEEEDTAMIWRGPILSGVIRQFYEQGLWSDLDVLLIDLPPGTSDAPLTVLQSLDVDGVVLVTMPQALATMIVRKAAGLVHQLKKPVLGVVENMSYFVAPDTGKRYDVFGPSYADQVAELARAPVLARVPLIPRVMELADAGRVEEIDDPVCDTLARALEGALAAHPRPKETISLL
jgi:hybrid cluster-associated redox disulfide protein